MAEKEAVPIHDGLFKWPAGEAQLICSKCSGCGELSFPKKAYCTNPGCPKGDVQDTVLGKRGKLYSYMIMHYAPPPPFDKIHVNVPYGLGLVDFPEGIMVLGILTTAQEADLRIGREMEVILDTVCTNEEGKEVITYKFKPV